MISHYCVSKIQKKCYYRKKLTTTVNDTTKTKNAGNDVVELIELLTEKWQKS